MNYLRLFLATLAGTVAYFAFGFLAFALVPSMKNEFLKYPAIYRTQEGIKSVMPLGMVMLLLSVFILAVLYALIYKGGSGFVEGARFGALIGIFVIGAFVFHNYVNLNIGLRITMLQSVAYFLEWMIVCIAIGLTYRPLA
jgi:hypothetical protein